jgi:hypothetical protein
MGMQSCSATKFDAQDLSHEAKGWLYVTVLLPLLRVNGKAELGTYTLELFGIPAEQRSRHVFAEMLKSISISMASADSTAQ